MHKKGCSSISFSLLGGSLSCLENYIIVEFNFLSLAVRGRKPFERIDEGKERGVVEVAMAQ